MLVAFLVASVVAAPAIAGPGSSPEWEDPWDDLRHPLTTVKLGPANPPQFIKFRDDGAGSNGVYTFAFEDEAVNPDQAFLTSQGPHGWLEGQSDVCLHFHYGPEDATTCNYRFCFEYAVADIGEAWPANSTIICTTFASSEDNTLHSVQEIGDIDMTGFKISWVLHGRLYRDSTNAADTCDGKDLIVHTEDFHIRLTRPGSRTETTQ